jgi:hypothetical protein
MEALHRSDYSTQLSGSGMSLVRWSHESSQAIPRSLNEGLKNIAGYSGVLAWDRKGTATTCGELHVRLVPTFVETACRDNRPKG